MNMNVMNKVKVFANEFVSCIIEENKLKYNWKITYSGDYDDEIRMEAVLSLWDDDYEDIGAISYNIVRNARGRYTYSTSFLFDEVRINSDDETQEEFKEIKNIINMYEDGLYDKICAYLHKCAMEVMDYGVEEDEDIGGDIPTYEEIYSPSRIKKFMKNFGISPYVPIVMEVVDEQGIPQKYLSIKAIGFNDESNNLIISMRED